MTFAVSAFAPVTLGFFGLGCGYLIYGPQELFGWPKRNESVDHAVGVWGIWMPGACQLLTGIILFIGMTWFQVFKAAPLYMAALAFSAYGIHWFAMGFNRMKGYDTQANAGMCVAYTILSILGMVVFFSSSGGWMVGLLFLGLTLIYITDFFLSIGVKSVLRLYGLWHVLTGLLLMYLTFGTTLNIVLGTHMIAG